MNLARTATFHFVAQVGMSVLGFLATLYFAREVGPGVLGTYFVIFALVTWLGIPENGISTAINKRVSEGENSGRVMAAGFSLNLAVAVLLFVGIFVFKGPVEDYIGAEVGEIVAVLAAVNVLFYTTAETLKGQQKVAQAGFVELFERFVRILFQIGLVFLGYRIVGLVLGHVGSLLVAGIVGILLFRARPSVPTRDEFRSLISYAKFSWLGSTKMRTFTWMDTLILNLFVAAALVGVYEIAWNLASVLTLVTSSIQNAVFPEISNLSARDRTTEVQDIVNDALAFAGVFVIPGFVGAAILGDSVLRVYGQEFVRGQYILLALIVARTIGVYEGVFTRTISAVDRPDLAFRINLSFITLNVTFNVVLIHFFGWYGAAVATALSSFVSLLLGYRMLSSIVGGIDFPTRTVAKQVAAGLAMGAVVYVSEGFVRVRVPGGIWNHVATVALVLLGGGVYLAVLVSVSPRTRQKVFNVVPFPM